LRADVALLETRNDFTNGIVAFDGAWLAGEVFVSFDKQAASLPKKQGLPVHLL